MVTTRTESEIARLGRRLFEDQQAVRPGRPLTEEAPGFTVEDAYAVQQAFMGNHLAIGRRLVGHKVGCTNRVVQQLFNVYQPDYGRILDSMVLPDGASIDRSTLIAPRIEPEVAFLLSEPLRGPGVTAEQVLGATEGLVPCFEIIDSRIEGWHIQFADTVADNGSSALVVLGERRRLEPDFDLRLMGVVLERNGEVEATGAGAAALGHPANAVAWLANTLATHGEHLQAGQLILPGALTTAVQIESGDSFVASFAGLGSVHCRIGA